MDLGSLGGIIGCALGLLGGLIGTACSIRRTRSPQERAFVIRAALGFWLMLGTCLALFFALPTPYKVFSFAPCWILLPFAIRYANKRQQELRNGSSRH